MRMAGPGSGERGCVRLGHEWLEVLPVGVCGVVWSQKGRSLPNVRLGDDLREALEGR